MALDEDQRAIREEVDGRGITRLVHFTHVENLRSITTYGLLSLSNLHERGLQYLRNDDGRAEGAQYAVYVNCSVQYPNLFLLDKFRERRGCDSEFVLIFLDPRLVWRTETRFCPVNAATSKGDHIASGIAGFRRLFESEVPSVSGRPRSVKHLRAAPTDMQAEVLVKDRIPQDAFMAIVTATPETYRRIRPEVRSSIKVQHCSQLFEKWELVNAIRDGHSTDPGS